MNRTPTIRQLQIIVALAEYKNISRVAEVLHIAQPSVSIQLKNLREIYDITLYHVNGRSVELTEAGNAVVNTAREMLLSLEKLQIELDNFKGIKSGVLKLAVVSTTKYFMPTLLGQFCKRYPLIDVQLSIGNRAEILKRFIQNKDDFYVFSQCPESEDVIATPFMENLLVVVAPANHELIQEMPISLNRLSNYPFLSREKGSGTRRCIEDFCKGHNLTLKIKMTIGSNEAIKHSVAADLGFSILSNHTLDYMEDKSLVRLDVEHFPIKSKWYIVRTKKRQQTLLGELFHQYLQDDGLSILQKTTKM